MYFRVNNPRNTALNISYRELVPSSVNPSQAPSTCTHFILFGERFFTGYDCLFEKNKK